ncbi:MAG: HYExAFE family protein [Phycisphaerales bacterium]
MAQRRHHYERAFEEYLRSRRIPYVSVDEARKALLPARPAGIPRGRGGGGGGGGVGGGQSADDLSAGLTPDAASGAPSLKSFDFVIYGQDGNLLIDIKGRRVSARGRMDESGRGGARVSGQGRSRLECWVTEDDIRSLSHWQGLFGDGFQAAFVFVYWCLEQPPDALFQEIFEYRGRWYALRAVTIEAYQQAMKPRSQRWRTVDLPTAAFERVSQPFAPPMLASAGGAPPGRPRVQQAAMHLGSGWRFGGEVDAGTPGRSICALDDPSLTADPGPQLPALHPYSS